MRSVRFPLEPRSSNLKIVVNPRFEELLNLASSLGVFIVAP
jgi:hypothetical protein